MLRVGTSGYSYAEWRGPFYPAGLPPRTMLSFYAQHFRAVAVNASYYRIPTPDQARRMAARAGGGLDFAIKAHRDLTHERERWADALPAFRAALTPFAEAGTLGTVLLQFPHAFHHTPENRDHLAALREALPGLPLGAKFRNRGWFNEQTYTLLRELGIVLCCVDAPPLPSLPPPVCLATGTVGYVRFHGRNAAAWWHHATAAERYTYAYRPDELAPWVPRLRQLAAETERCYAFFNNHARGQAALDAKQLLALLQDNT